MLCVLYGLQGQCLGYKLTPQLCNYLSVWMRYGDLYNPTPKVRWICSICNFSHICILSQLHTHFSASEMNFMWWRQPQVSRKTIFESHWLIIDDFRQHLVLIISQNQIRFWNWHDKAFQNTYFGYDKTSCYSIYAS